MKASTMASQIIEATIEKALAEEQEKERKREVMRQLIEAQEHSRSLNDPLPTYANVVPEGEDYAILIIPDEMRKFDMYKKAKKLLRSADKLTLTHRISGVDMSSGNLVYTTEDGLALFNPAHGASAICAKEGHVRPDGQAVHSYATYTCNRCGSTQENPDFFEIKSMDNSIPANL